MSPGDINTESEMAQGRWLSPAETRSAEQSSRHRQSRSQSPRPGQHSGTRSSKGYAIRRKASKSSFEVFAFLVAVHALRAMRLPSGPAVGILSHLPWPSIELRQQSRTVPATELEIGPEKPDGLGVDSQDLPARYFQDWLSFFTSVCALRWIHVGQPCGVVLGFGTTSRGRRNAAEKLRKTGQKSGKRDCAPCEWQVDSASGSRYP